MSLLYVVTLCGLLCSSNADLLNDKSTADTDIEGYYWRNYKGVIPKDAFAAGLDAHGNISYVGQTLFNSLLVPGEIVASEKRMRYEWGWAEHIATENVKILCTQYPLMFQWVITNHADFKGLTDQHFVPGGYEPENRVFIGRTTDGTLRLGKITVRNNDNYAVLHYVKDGKGHFAEEFEVLTSVNEIA